MNGIAGEAAPPRVAAGFFRMVDGELAELVTTAAGALPVWFVVGIRDAERITSGHQLTVELWRGNELRHRREDRAQLDDRGAWHGVYRLHWRNRPAASSRLRCRVALDGRHFGWWELLVKRIDVDAQGRLPEHLPQHESADTLLSYQRQLAALFAAGRQVEPSPGGGKKLRPPVRRSNNGQPTGPPTPGEHPC